MQINPERSSNDPIPKDSQVARARDQQHGHSSQLPISRNTVTSVLKHAREIDLSYPEAEGLTDKGLGERALGMAASRAFLTVRYARLPDILTEMAIARGNSSFRKVMKQYKQVSC